ncbi:MAG: hypothetical protein IPL75_00950 [Acidobacteria bacterium]|jgi:hypothetical protein|nr:hypothetical protein [Acidobacteriota bacterium]
MDRLKGLRTFLLITGVVALGLRLLHTALPVAFPETRQGPIRVERLEDVRRLAGFTPLIPGYRPATLGTGPVSMQVWLSPSPTFEVVWQQGDQYLSVTQRRGGQKPAHPPLAAALGGVPGSTWWMEGSRHHVLLERGEFWVEIETSLPEGELRRFADTLAPA